MEEEHEDPDELWKILALRQDDGQFQLPNMTTLIGGEYQEKFTGIKRIILARNVNRTADMENDGASPCVPVKKGIFSYCNYEPGVEPLEELLAREQLEQWNMKRLFV
ncbi:hypothetical protein M422DRAFT_259712 [Sphaerobolus stellatus SS14]|uniref:Uncharacterized protein n=1 Tax=Sphaerobolus stellatus (strain SS14) TaxID=990650 RepID=A0A0C9USP5_SPHS4|nr:hypothetical protein M422DRAFT_259712 [Sphaerobolus stellatus SS14]